MVDNLFTRLANGAQNVLRSSEPVIATNKYLAEGLHALSGLIHVTDAQLTNDEIKKYLSTGVSL